MPKLSILNAFFVVTFSSFLYPSVSGTNMIFLGDFEIGGLSRFSFSGNDTVEIVTEPVRKGKYAAKFYLDRLRSEVSYRTEIVPVNQLPEYRKEGGRKRSLLVEIGGEYWYAFSSYIPRNWVRDPEPEIIAQWHGRPDKHLGEANRSPPLAIRIQGDSYIVDRRWDSTLITPRKRKKRYSGEEYIAVGPISGDLGKWTDWVVHVKWSYRDEAEGMLRIWKNGHQIVERVGPNCFNDEAGGPYFKIGVYKWRWKNPPKDKRFATDHRVIYFDEVLIWKHDMAK